MNDHPPKNKLFGLSMNPLQELVEKMKGKGPETRPAPDLLAPTTRNVPEKYYRFELMESYQELSRGKYLLDLAGYPNPYYRLQDGIARDTTTIDGRSCVNYATYNYLDLCGHPEVSAAAKAAIDQSGTSALAARLAAGNKPIHLELEKAIAELMGTEDSLIFVSGHATNVTTIGVLVGARDLILHDSLIHNSVTQGALLSGAHRVPFPHNDMDALDRLLVEQRGRYERVLVVVEGLYSMDGDLPPLPRLIELRRKHRFLLMIDEAHSIGVVGETGRGIREHHGVAPTDVDIWMGTLSKTLAGCGGYIAGSRVLTDLLRYRAPGFVYSVGMPPPMAAASLAALRLMLREPWRVATLRARTRLFLELARQAGLDTGFAEGYGIVPVIGGSTRRAGLLAHRLFERGINVVPIIAPAVEEKAARVRFFFSSAHTEEQIRSTVAAVTECIPRF